MIALYDLANRPATYDVFTFLALSKLAGADHVRFVYGAWKPKNYSIKSAEERFESIVRPAPGFFGLPYSIGPREGVEFTHIMGELINAYKKVGRIPKIQHPYQKGNGDYVTITLRRSRTPERDSNEAEWQKFASKVNRRVVMLRDWDERQLPIEERMRLYAGAHMNFFVNNGPLLLCILSDAPYLAMRYICEDNCLAASPKWMEKSLGITPGFQYPWRVSRQRLSYLPDTCENIESEYAAMEQVERLVANG